MVWTQLKLLLPSYLGYWVFLTVLFTGTWLAWTKIYKTTQFSWKLPVLVASAFTIYSVASLLLGFYQTNTLTQFQQKTANAQRAQNPTQLKADFLKIVENLAAAPEKITPELKEKFFTEYAPLFPNGAKDKKEYENAVRPFFECHRIFWEDAIVSFKTKTPTKSDDRKNCEKLGGTFFGRDKLFTMETLKNDDEMISNLAGHKRLPTSEGKTIEPTESMLASALSSQVKSVEGVKKLFE